MNGKAILATMERHIEKVIIALAGLFLLGMIWLYGINTPNKVPFNSAEYGPRDLSDAVLASAKELESAMKRADPGKVDPAQSKDTLLKAHAEGIFSALTPAKPDAPDAKGIKLQPVARTLMIGGKEAVVPGLTEAEEATGSIALVTPLPPDQPVLSYGRSQAVQKSVVLGDAAPRTGAGPAGKDEKAADPTEVGWVSIAGYWDSAAQRSEMTKNGYAAYRAKVYVAGIDVERQELLATGDWSEPKVVEGSKAMPAFKIPEPAIDDRGFLVNKPDIEEAFRTVRAEQNTLIQPAFYTVTAGDEWKQPPLDGHVEEEDDGGVVVKPKPKPPQERTTRRPPAPPPITPRGGAPGFSDVVGGGGGGRTGEGGGGGAVRDRKAEEQGKKQARDDMKEGRDLMTKKDYSGAAGKFQAVVNNQYATATDKRNAEAELEKAQKKLAEASASSGGGPVDSRVISEGGGPGIIPDNPNPRGFGFSPVASPTGKASTLVTHPSRNVPAAFFHDDTVEPGKTYRYRMRVNLWNRYVGQIKSLKDPAGARQPVLHGEWSLWSEPVTTTPQTHFFVNSLKPGTDKLSVEVWKWIKGKWIKRNVEAGVGDVIGGEFVLKDEERGEDTSSTDEKKTEKPKATPFDTGAVVLDIRVEQPVKVRLNKGKGQFDYTERKSLVLVYLDPADGQVKERIQALDATDPLRKKLKEQAGDGT